MTVSFARVEQRFAQREHRACSRLPVSRRCARILRPVGEGEGSSWLAGPLVFALFRGVSCASVPRGLGGSASPRACWSFPGARFQKGVSRYRVSDLGETQMPKGAIFVRCKCRRLSGFESSDPTPVAAMVRAHVDAKLTDCRRPDRHHATCPGASHECRQRERRSRRSFPATHDVSLPSCSRAARMEPPSLWSDKRLGTRRNARKTASDGVPAWGGAARAAPKKRG